MPLMPDRTLPPSVTDALGDLHFGMRCGRQIVPCQVTREYLARLTGQRSPGIGAPGAFARLDQLAEGVRDMIAAAASRQFDTAGADRRGIVVLTTSQIWQRIGRLRRDRPGPAPALRAASLPSHPSPSESVARPRREQEEPSMA